jgi:hypothetical protein
MTNTFLLCLLYSVVVIASGLLFGLAALGLGVIFGVDFSGQVIGAFMGGMLLAVCGLGIAVRRA